jgi:hypothetical protein
VDRPLPALEGQGPSRRPRVPGLDHRCIVGLLSGRYFSSRFQIYTKVDGEFRKVTLVADAVEWERRIDRGDGPVAVTLDSESAYYIGLAIPVAQASAG